MLRPRSLSSSRSASERFRTERDSAMRVAICTSPIMHLICSPKFCITFVFHFPMGITAVPREIENNADAKFWRANKAHYERCANGICLAKKSQSEEKN